MIWPLPKKVSFTDSLANYIPLVNHAPLVTSDYLASTNSMSHYDAQCRDRTIEYPNEAYDSIDDEDTNVILDLAQEGDVVDKATTSNSDAKVILLSSDDDEEKDCTLRFPKLAPRAVDCMGGEGKPAIKSVTLMKVKGEPLSPGFPFSPSLSDDHLDLEEYEAAHLKRIARQSVYTPKKL